MRPPNVVLICLDTVRADHLGVHGYVRATTPTLDALAARALVFDSTSSCAGWTKPSVASFLTGTHPCQHGVYGGNARVGSTEMTDALPARALTLAEVFEQHGYRTGAFVHNAHLRVGNGFDQGFGDYEQGQMDARALRWRGLDWLDQGSKSEQPFFLYLHFLDAHWPYPAPEQWLTRFASAEVIARFRGHESKALYAAINDGTYVMSTDDRAALEALYDGALAYLDSELGRFLAGLELRGLEESTIVCVIADHGEEFGEHGRVGHGHGLFENLLHVPWILHVPGRAPARNSVPVSLIDLFPTLLSAARLPRPDGLDGIDRLAEGNVRRALLAEHKSSDRYTQTLRVENEKLQRSFRAPPGLERVEIVLPIALGSRWEAEFEVVGDELVATQLKPRDEAPEEPLELKGPIADVSASEFRLAGIRVRYNGDSKLQVDTGTSGPTLANGLVVKVRGPILDGALYAERIKFYAPDEEPLLELRARVEKLEYSQGSGSLTLGAFTLRITPDTHLKDMELPSENRPLAREQLAALLAGGGASFAAANGFESERRLYDLSRDPGELAAQELPPGSVLEASLDELGAALIGRRIFGTADQHDLGDEARAELEALGYGGDQR
ncbi:MAG: sulfatase [Planctomycetes bacterium]|nr:sulfatase [Planctomycetota bacterium]